MSFNLASGSREEAIDTTIVEIGCAVFWTHRNYVKKAYNSGFYRFSLNLKLCNWKTYSQTEMMRSAGIAEAWERGRECKEVGKSCLQLQ